jgi:hypothetical protein
VFWIFSAHPFWIISDLLEFEHSMSWNEFPAIPSLRAIRPPQLFRIPDKFFGTKQEQAQALQPQPQLQ